MDYSTELGVCVLSHLRVHCLGLGKVSEQLSRSLQLSTEISANCR